MPDCHLGVWEIAEDFDALYEMVELAPVEQAKLESFRNISRKVEWLSVRALAKNMLGKDTRILYNAENKPFVKGNTHNISISHSNKLTAVLISKDRRVGIDLEYMSGKISKVANKFINPREHITEDPKLRKFHLYLHWCAKEALYKICDKQDINFKDGITISSFDPEDHGFMSGHVINGNGDEHFEMEYLHHENYALVWCVKA
ncbi:MAG: 4'-phosphopantetheinyl transferase [Bacteroidetes bacterium]|nr:MAG: 4'-phosphopantetheinyl transferase [Bacteroidota bacterium]